MQTYNDKLKPSDVYDINAFPKEITNIENA